MVDAVAGPCVFSLMSSCIVSMMVSISTTLKAQSSVCWKSSYVHVSRGGGGVGGEQRDVAKRFSASRGH